MTGSADVAAGSSTPVDGIAATRGLRTPPGPERLGSAYSGTVAAFRAFVDAFAGAAPPEAELRRLEQDLRRWAAVLADLRVPDAQGLWGRWLDRPDRSQGLVPPISNETVAPGSVAGTVVFGRFHSGKNDVTHGGSVALLFDELFGRMGFSLGLAGRTASLAVSYRSVAPVDTHLDVEGSLVKVEGRKHFFRGRLRRDDVVCAEAECLWVELKAGQP